MNKNNIINPNSSSSPWMTTTAPLPWTTPQYVRPLVKTTTTSSSIPYDFMGTPKPYRTELQQKILEHLRLATYAGCEPNADVYLVTLAMRLETIFNQELNSWKALLTGETNNNGNDLPDCVKSP